MFRSMGNNRKKLFSTQSHPIIENASSVEREGTKIFLNFGKDYRNCRSFREAKQSMKSKLPGCKETQNRFRVQSRIFTRKMWLFQLVQSIWACLEVVTRRNVRELLRQDLMFEASRSGSELKRRLDRTLIRKFSWNLQQFFIDSASFPCELSAQFHYCFHLQTLLKLHTSVRKHPPPFSTSNKWR